MQRILCPHCNKKLKYDDALEGISFNCPGCHKRVKLPGHANVAEELRETGRKLKRAVVPSGIALAVVGGSFLVYWLASEPAKPAGIEPQPIRGKVTLDVGPRGGQGSRPPAR